MFINCPEMFVSELAAAGFIGGNFSAMPSL
jgi:hypothetical protein